MNRRITPDEESPLSELFETLTPPLEDEGFSGNVVRRISRRLWVRRIALGTATPVGGVLAFGPFSELAVFLAQGVIEIATRWNDPAWLAQNQALLIVALLAVVWPGAIRLLEP